MDITLKLATAPGYSWDLIYTNMEPYYRLRRYSWDKADFFASWAKFINVEVFFGEEKVGIIRLAQRGERTHVYTLQIEKRWQGKGIGWQCLSRVEEYARTRCSRGVSLSVFAENPARKLYQRYGFVEMAEQNDIFEMIYDFLPQQGCAQTQEQTI